MAPNFCPNCGKAVEDRERADCDECGQDFDESDKPNDEEFESLGGPEADDELPVDESRNADDHLFGSSASDHQASSVVEHHAPREKKWWEPVIVVLRWIGFIPAGILGGIAAGIVSYFFFGAGAWLSGYPFDSPWNRLVIAGIGGYTSVFLGAHTAPIAHKAVPAIVMAILMFMMYGIAILVNVGDREWFRIVQSIVGVIAVAGSMYQQIEESRPNPT